MYVCKVLLQGVHLLSCQTTQGRHVWADSLCNLNQGSGVDKYASMYLIAGTLKADGYCRLITYQFRQIHNWLPNFPHMALALALAGDSTTIKYPRSHNRQLKAMQTGLLSIPGPILYKNKHIGLPDFQNQKTNHII